MSGFQRPRSGGQAAAGGRSRVGEILELDIGNVAHGGHCVARQEGRVVFVRHALPGERVRARVTDGADADRYWRADAIEVIQQAPGRVPAPCPYAGPGGCGGCDWQHASVEVQRELKARVVADQLRQLAHIDRTITVEPVPGDDQGLGWRTRVSFSADEAGRLGFHRHRSHDIVPVARCLIAHADVTAVGAERHTWPGVASVEVVASNLGDRAVVVAAREGGASLRLPRLDPDVSVLAKGTRGAGRVRGRKYVREQAAGRSWRVSGGGFWQVHPGAADTLVAAALAGIEPKEGETALDLYAGVGLFAGALADRVGPSGAVTAIEADRRAIGDARRNLHDLPSVTLIEGRVESTLSRLGLTSVDVAILDPPRAGAGRSVVQILAGLRPRAIAYVACDPAAMARDVATFEGLGYRLDSLRAFDLFPMTHHVECVAVLCPVAG